MMLNFIVESGLREDDVISLQNDINNLVEWSKLQWQLPFNVEKCKCMHIGRDTNHHS